MIEEFDHENNSKGQNLHDLINENKVLKVQIFKSKEEASHFSDVCNQLCSDLELSRLTSAKIEEAISMKTNELNVSALLKSSSFLLAWQS